MVNRTQKNQNSLNLFLNNYFSVIMVVIVVVLLASAYFVLLRPKFNRTKLAIQENMEQQQKLYSEQQKKLNNLQTIATLYKKINLTDLNKFNNILPNNYVKEKLFGELEEIINRHGFVVSSISIDTKIDEAIVPGRSPQLGLVGLQFSVRTIDYAGFKNLLRVLENNQRLFDIKQVSFSPSGNTADFLLETYYYKNPK